MSNDQSNPNSLANLGPLFNFINSHHNSPQDTQNSSSENGEHGYYDGEVEDEKWQDRGLIEEDYSNDEQMDHNKINNDLEDENLLDDTVNDYVHDLSTPRETVTSDLAQNNKENKLAPNVLENLKEQTEDQMNLDEQTELRDKRITENNQPFVKSEHQNIDQLMMEHKNQSTDLDD